MNISDIYTHSSGSRFLAACPAKAQENMLEYLYASMPAAFKAKNRAEQQRGYFHGYCA